MSLIDMLSAENLFATLAQREPKPPIEDDDSDRIAAEEARYRELRAGTRRADADAERRKHEEARLEAAHAAHQRAEAERNADPLRCDLARLELDALDDTTETLEDFEDADALRYEVIAALETHRRARVSARVLSTVRTGPGFHPLSADRYRVEGRAGVAVVGLRDDGLIGARYLSPDPPEGILGALAREIVAVVQRGDKSATAKAEERAEESLLAECSIAAQAADVGAQRDVIDRLYPDASLTLLVGAIGSGKTFKVMSQAIAVGTGIPWLTFGTTQGRVLLVLLEGSRIDRIRRLRSIAIGMGTTLEALEDVVLLYPHTLNTTDEASFVRFVDYCARMKPRLTIIDNLSEIAGDDAAQGSTNDVSAMKAVLKPLANLAQGKIDRAPASAIVLLHHANAAGGIRGGGPVGQHIDHVIYLDRTSDRNDSPIAIRRGKSRSGTPLAEFSIRFIDREDKAIVPELVRTKQGSDGPAPHRDQERRDQLLELLPLSAEELYSAMRDDHGCGRTVCKKVRDQLEVEGVIAHRDGVWRRAE